MNEQGNQDNTYTKEIEKYVFRYLHELSELERKMELQRADLYDTPQFDEEQFFRMLAQDEFENPLEYISFDILSKYIKKIFGDYFILDKEIQYLCTYFSEKNNNFIYLENIQDLLLPHKNKVNRDYLAFQRSMGIQQSGMTMSKQVENKIIHLLKNEIELFRKTERMKMEMFELFEWDILTIPFLASKNISFNSLMHFMKRFKPQINENICIPIWRRFFFISSRKYSSKIVPNFMLKQCFIPLDYFSHVNLKKDNFIIDDFNDNCHFKNTQNKRKDGVYADYTTPVLNENWQKDKNKPTYIQFYNNTSNLKTINSDKFAKEFEQFLYISDKREQKAKRQQELLEADKIIPSSKPAKKQTNHKFKDQYTNQFGKIEDEYMKKQNVKYYYNEISKLNREQKSQQKPKQNKAENTSYQNQNYLGKQHHTVNKPFNYDF